MDDLTNQLSARPPMDASQESWHAEMRRRQYDIIRVLNPLNEDFYVEYDTNQHQRVPANSTLDIPRYIAERYCKHMTDHIVHARGQKMHDDTIKERNSKGFPNYKSKWEENEETYNSADYPRTNDPAVATPIWNELWVGLVSEVGKDVPPALRQEESKTDLFEVQMLRGLQNKRVDAGNSPVMQSTVEPQQYAPTSQLTPQAEFIPQNQDRIDFSALNDSLDKKGED